MSNVDEQGEAAGEAVAAATVLKTHVPGPSAGGWTGVSIFTLAFLTLISTLNYFDRSVLALVLPLIKAEMHVSDTTLGIVTSLILFYAVLGVPIASLADRWSRKYVIAIGFSFWSVMTILTGFAANIFQLGFFRFFMGAGEACGLAPSQSMLSDVFDRARRPIALAVLTTASSLAAIIYSPIAGWVAGHYGWRATFIVAGAPGVILALLFVLLIKEPRRGASEPAGAPVEPAPLKEALAFLAGSRAYLLLLLGTTLMGVYLYGVGAWGATFLVRVRHLSIPEIGAYISPVRGAVAAGGILLGGILASNLERVDQRWRCWIPGLACLLLAPCEFLFVFADQTWIWVSAMIASSLFSIMHQGPVYAAYVSVAKPRMRAVSVSVALLGATVVGQFGGPILIGWLNDTLSATYGDGAIRYSLLVTQVVAVLGGLSFAAAGRFIKADTARATA